MSSAEERAFRVLAGLVVAGSVLIALGLVFSQ
jgi:hypothetical protein